MARKKQRETYGNGSVTPVMIAKDGKKIQERDKQGRPVWRVCITLGVEEYVDKNGKLCKRQRKVQKRVHGTLDEARKIAEQMTSDYSHIDRESAGMSFGDVCKAWADAMELEHRCSCQLLRQYCKRLGYMASYLDDRPIAELKRSDIERALTAVKASRGLSNSTMRDIVITTRRVFEYAVETERILANPCRGIKAPKNDKVKDRRSLTQNEAARLRACLDRDEEDAYRSFSDKEKRQVEWGTMFGRSALKGISMISGLLAVRIMLATGCRRGESLALTWDDVSFEESAIRIRHSLTAEMEVKEPKSDAGIRSLSVDADTMMHLGRWKAFQAKALHLIMPDGAVLDQTSETPVCCSCTGGWLHPTNFSRWWRDYRVEAGFPELKVHELRHTSATLLLGAGVDVKTVQTRLGHSDVSLTLNQYAHAIPANDRAAADLMGSILAIPNEPSARVIELEQATA